MTATPQTFCVRADHRGKVGNQNDWRVVLNVGELQGSQ